MWGHLPKGVRLLERVDLSNSIRKYKNGIAIGKFEFSIILMVILGSIVLHSSVPVLAASRFREAAETSCPPSYNHHCYAVNQWPGNTPGAFTEVSPYGSINCASCSAGGFITQEMWYEDTSSSQCTPAPYYACWVEGGLLADSNGVHMFWADNRPGLGLSVHLLYVVAPNGGSLDPYVIDFAVHSAGGNYTSTNTWNVSVNLYTNGSLTKSYNAQSTANQMTPNWIQIGS